MFTESLTLPIGNRKRRPKAQTDQQVPFIVNLEDQRREEFVITLDDQEWNLGSVQGHSQETDVHVQLLATLKTPAKDDKGKTYWVFSDENTDNYKKGSIFGMRPSVSLAKNIKEKSQCFHC